MLLFNKKLLETLPRLTEAKFFFVIQIAFILLFASCKESSVINLDVSPMGNVLNVTIQDSTTLVTKTVAMDPLLTNEPGAVLLGTYMDPVFGKSSASIYTQIGLDTTPNFGASSTIDSVILTLVYDSTYNNNKDAITQQVINVHQALEPIEADKDYNSSSSIITSTTDLVDHAKGLRLVNDGNRSQIKIHLTKSWGDTILASNTSTFESNTSFQNSIRGFFITTENTTNLNADAGNIMRFDLADNSSNLTLYYHNNSDTSKYNFTIGKGAQFSQFKHDYTFSDSHLKTQLSTTSTTQNDVVFLQSMAGLKVKIEMPYIMAWNNLEPAAINKAELVVKVDTSSKYGLNTYDVPEKLILYSVDNNVNGIESNYDSDNFEYRVNISRYIQQVLLGEKDNNGLYLLPLSTTTNTNRVVVGGGGNSTYQMKLNITRTKLP